MAVRDIRLDLGAPLATQVDGAQDGRRPEDIAVLRVVPGDEVVVDTLDGTDTQITPESVAPDLANLDLDRCHPLTGPIAVEGAEPGDVLVLDILDCHPAPFGYTALRPGVGLLGDEPEFADPFLVLWRLADGYAISADVPGVRIPPRPFLGTATLSRGRTGTTAQPQTARRQPAGRCGTTGGDVGMAYAEVGTRLLLPVWTSEAMMSLGDSHFAQGQGQIGTGIKMAATWRLRVELRKHDATIRGQRQPHFERASHHHNHSSDTNGGGTNRVFATTSVRDGLDHDELTHQATREALLEMIDYLRDEHRYSAQQAYALCGAAVHLRITLAPHHTHTPVTVTALLPLHIFD